MCGERRGEGREKKFASGANGTEGARGAHRKKIPRGRIESVAGMGSKSMVLKNRSKPVISGHGVSLDRSNPDKSGQCDTSPFPEYQANSLTGASGVSENRSDPAKSGHGKCEEREVESGTQ